MNICKYCQAELKEGDYVFDVIPEYNNNDEDKQYVCDNPDCCVEYMMEEHGCEPLKDDGKQGKIQ